MNQHESEVEIEAEMADNTRFFDWLSQKRGESKPGKKVRDVIPVTLKEKEEEEEETKRMLDSIIHQGELYHTASSGKLAGAGMEESVMSVGLDRKVNMGASFGGGLTMMETLRLEMCMLHERKCAEPGIHSIRVS